ncbi:hypothetical protein N7451_001896 [Penicillium sp. IBT 35674x]|nr:hypothetical protein N7451_001896 [Penicillium sp. IBT 35674x]
MTVAAVPVILTGGSNAVRPRSEEDLIDNAGTAANVLSNGDSTGVQSAKCANDVSVGPLEAGLPGVDVGNVVKRTEDVTIGPIDIRR